MYTTRRPNVTTIVGSFLFTARNRFGKLFVTDLTTRLRTRLRSVTRGHERLVSRIVYGELQHDRNEGWFLKLSTIPNIRTKSLVGGQVQFYSGSHDVVEIAFLPFANHVSPIRLKMKTFATRIFYICMKCSKRQTRFGDGYDQWLNLEKEGDSGAHFFKYLSVPLLFKNKKN